VTAQPKPAVTTAADDYSDRLEQEDLATRFVWQGRPLDESVGVLLLRNICHYWFHIGKAHSARQASD
jgi:hypothetical protein